MKEEYEKSVEETTAEIVEKIKNENSIEENKEQETIEEENLEKKKEYGGLFSDLIMFAWYGLPWGIIITMVLMVAKDSLTASKNTETANNYEVNNDYSNTYDDYRLIVV